MGIWDITRGPVKGRGGIEKKVSKGSNKIEKTNESKPKKMMY